MERFALYVAAAATTATAGVLHLMMGPNALEFKHESSHTIHCRRNCSSILDHTDGKKVGYTLVRNRDRRDYCINGYLDYYANARKSYNWKSGSRWHPYSYCN